MTSRRRHTSAAAECSVLLLMGLLVCGIVQTGCGSEKAIYDEAKAAEKTVADFPPDDFDYFPGMDRFAVKGASAHSETEDGWEAHDDRPGADVIRGRNTWMMWTGGNEAFWDWIANHSYGFVDLLKIVDFRPQDSWSRFQEAGLIVEPHTRVPLTADRYGLYIRQPVDPSARQPAEATFGRSSGIVGLRLYRNPKFDASAAQHWDVVRYYNDPTYYLDPTLVRPYRVGMACAFCHVSPHPLNPPLNEEKPDWANLSATIGNQYLRTRRVFGNMLKPNAYFYHLLDSQLPGALDTSLIPSDNINNPNTENAIWELGARLDRAGTFDHRESIPGYKEQYLEHYSTNSNERVGDAAALKPVLSYREVKPYANPRPVPRIIIDGSDSVGGWTALARVYLNIGVYSERWVTLHNPLIGFRKQQPFTLADLEAGSVYWRTTESLIDDLAKYLIKASNGMPLREAPGGTAYVKGDGVPWAEELAQGRRVFRTHCIVCHSSKQPKIFDDTPDNEVLGLLSNEKYKTWAKEEVDRPEFWKENYLSTDRRLPISLIKTNASRGVGSNSIEGNLYEEFSSSTYKGLPPSPPIPIWNPFTHQTEKMTLPRGGRGYYRPASLVSIWATAPFLHNNSVGLFNNDPSVEGRLRAFTDAIDKLLVAGPTEKAAATARVRKGSSLNGATYSRLEQDHGLIWRLPQPASIRIPGNQLPYFLASLSGKPQVVFEWLWIVPILVVALATLCMVSGGRWRRRVGYGLILLGFLMTIPALWVSGKLVDLSVTVPAGLPVDALANIDPQKVAHLPLLKTAKLLFQINRMPAGSPTTDQKLDKLGQLLYEVSKSPDYVMDKGHYFGRALETSDRDALIDLLKTF